MQWINIGRAGTKTLDLVWESNWSIRLFPMKCSWMIPTLEYLDGVQSEKLLSDRGVEQFYDLCSNEVEAEVCFTMISPWNRKVYHSIFPAKRIFCIYFDMTKRSFKTLDFVNATPARLNGVCFYFCHYVWQSWLFTREFAGNQFTSSPGQSHLQAAHANFFMTLVLPEGPP